MSAGSLPDDVLARKMAYASGRAAGYAAVAEIRRIEPTDPRQEAWLAGFLQGAIDATADRPAETRPKPAVAVHPMAAELPDRVRVAATRMALRVSALEPHFVDGSNDWLSVALEVKDQRLEYAPGSSLALWPNNDPEDVRRILKALRVNPQQPFPTGHGPEPAWQVLLERVNIGAVNQETIRRLARFARATSEASRLSGLSKQPIDKPLSLLALLRRHPSLRPPIEELLASLPPLEPSIVPIASSCLEHPRPLLFAHRFTPAGSGWGHVGPEIRSKFRVGEWLSVSIDAQNCPLGLRDDDLMPVIIVADGPFLALARSLVAQRRERRAMGRTWVLVTGVGSEQFPYSRALSSWQRSGDLSRVDIAVGLDPTELLKILEPLENKLWHWLAEGAQLFLISPRRELRTAMNHWLMALLRRQYQLDAPSAARRLRELSEHGQWMVVPADA